MSQFYLTSASPSSSASSSPRSSTETALPFPTPLPRSDFHASDFSPSTYLSELAPSRHQVLEDLRSDLRARFQHLSRELLDLVNAHYADFLGLGGNLRGGREKVEEVSVGLMGFQREVEGVRANIVEKELEVKALVEERRRIRMGMETGRALLEWESKVGMLEDRLGLGGLGEMQMKQKVEEHTDEEESDSDEDRGEALISDEEANENDGRALDTVSAPAIFKLRRRIQEYKLLQQSAVRLGLAHPFIVSQQSRILRIRNTLLLDLGGCLRHTHRNPGRRFEIVAMFRDMDAGKEAVEGLRSLRRTAQDLR